MSRPGSRHGVCPIITAQDIQRVLSSQTISTSLGPSIDTRSQKQSLAEAQDILSTPSSSSKKPRTDSASASVSLHATRRGENSENILSLFSIRIGALVYGALIQRTGGGGISLWPLALPRGVRILRFENRAPGW